MGLGYAIGGLAGGAGKGLSNVADLLAQRDRDRRAEKAHHRAMALEAFLHDLQLKSANPANALTAGDVGFTADMAAQPGGMQTMQDTVQQLQGGRQDIAAAGVGGLGQPNAEMARTPNVLNAQRLERVIGSAPKPKPYAPTRGKEYTWADALKQSESDARQDSRVVSIEQKLIGYYSPADPEYKKEQMRRDDLVKKIRTERVVTYGQFVLGRLPTILELRKHLGAQIDEPTAMAMLSSMAQGQNAPAGAPGAASPPLVAPPGSVLPKGYSAE